VISTLQKSGIQFSALVRLCLAAALTALLSVAQDKALELPKEREMSPKDKYTTFSRYGSKHRKSVHKVRGAFYSSAPGSYIPGQVPHFTKVTMRNNPTGF
jgi:hypothetical protein